MGDGKACAEEQGSPSEAREGCGGNGAAFDDGSYDRAVAGLRRLLGGAPLHREIYLRLLNFCKERRLLSEAEAVVGRAPGFSTLAQSPYRLIRDLVDEGGLDWIDLDADGLDVTPERTAGLSADQIDDLVADFALETTAAGADAAEAMSPERRLDALLQKTPEREQAFTDVLAFCEEPRTFGAVQEFLEKAGVLGPLRAANGRPLQASFFVDMLERAGGLEWDGAWRVTEAGRALLDRLAA